MELPKHIHRSRWILFLFISVNGLFSTIGIASLFGYEIMEGGAILLFSVPILAYVVALALRDRPTISIHQDRIEFCGDEKHLKMEELVSITTNDEGFNSESPQDLIFEVNNEAIRRVRKYPCFHKTQNNELYLQFTGRQITCHQAVDLITQTLEQWKQNQSQ